MKAAWNEPDQFDWITTFLQERDLLHSARLILATVAASAGVVPLTLLVGQRHPTATLLCAQLGGATLAVTMAIWWSRKWPTRRQSQAAALGGLLCIAGWSQAVPSAAFATQICMAAAITGGYVAFLHGTKLLVLNFAVAVLLDSLTLVRLLRETDLLTAAGSFWLILFLNLSVPVAIRGMSYTIRLYATRSGEDPLTGLLNRRVFTATVIGRLRRTTRAATHLSVLMVDLDNFKRINDTYGHAAGDRTLIAVAELLRSHTAPDAAICRAGGEEFLVAVACATDDPAPMAEHLCTAIASLSPNITASIGTTSTALRGLPRPVTSDVIEQLIAVADNAMYTAKRNGGHNAYHH